MQPSNTRRKTLHTIAVYLLLAVASALAVTPVLYSFLSSFKTQKQFLSEGPLALPNPVTLENYHRLFTETDVPRAFIITAAVVAVTAAGQLITSILAAYAFARLRFWGRDTLFWVYLATMMIPAAVTFIPLFMLLSQAGLKNTFWGIALPFMFVSPYAIFLLRQYFLSIPQEIFDAARLDGASHWKIMWRIVVPEAKPVIATLLVITVVTHWNNFLWPLMISPASGVRTLTVATAQLQTAHDGQWWLVTAATTVAIVPLVILLFVFHKQLLRSISAPTINT